MTLLAAIFLIFVAAICRSISHKITRDFNNSIFYNCNQLFWNPNITKDIERGSITIMGYYIKLPTADALHLANSLEISLLLLVPFIYQPLFKLDVFIYLGLIIIYTSTFLTFYKNILNRKVHDK